MRQSLGEGDVITMKMITFILCILYFTVELIYPAEPPEKSLADYQAELNACRNEHGGSYDLPDVKFFLFGMGKRAKMIYRDGILTEAKTGREIRRWKVRKEIIVPPDYKVWIETMDGSQVVLREDADAVWLDEADQHKSLSGTTSAVKLPDFAGKKFPRVLRVLHQELLVNISEAGPVPNLFVYPKPWYRDGAMVALALKETGNVGLLRNWILGLTDPFDRNNAGVTEPDNLGQVLFLVSLVSDKKHPVVARIMNEAMRFEVSDTSGKFIKANRTLPSIPSIKLNGLNTVCGHSNCPTHISFRKCPIATAHSFGWIIGSSIRKGKTRTIASIILILVGRAIISTAQSKAR